MPEHVKVERDGRLMIITMNRPGSQRPHWGFAAGGSSQKLSLRMPKSIVIGMLLTGSRMGTEEEACWGLVN